MARRRLLRFFVTVMAVFVVAAMLAVIAGGFVVMRGPNVPQDATLILRIGGNLVETPPTDVVGQLTGSNAQTLRSYVEALHRAKADPRIKSVLIVPSGFESPYWAKIQELRDAILDFRKSGKRANAFLEYGGDREYYLATACDRIFMIPTSSLDVKGIASYTVFLRGTLDKIGAYADFERIAEYKTATNQLTEKDFTPAHREMDEALNRDMYDQIVKAIADSRKRSVADVQALIDQGPFLAQEALSAGLIDTLAYDDQLDDRGGASATGTIEGEDYARVRRRSSPRAPRMAVINLSGFINSGDSGTDPLNGRVSGSREIVKAIRAARADNGVRAIIVRIDSPGGSAVASDVIWRELAVTRDEKPARPLIASMSDLAASGGYYIAVAAPYIVAQPATLTGSIGVLGGKLVTGPTYEKLGANIRTLAIGKNAALESPERPFTDSERAEVRQLMRSFYDGFVSKVAQSRKMTVEGVDQIARGRVWTGAQAQQRGLVDALGGLDHAIAVAKQRAGIPADTEVDVVNYPAPKTLYELLIERLSGQTSTMQVDALLGAVQLSLSPGERQAVGLLTAPMRLFKRGEPLALMPLAFSR